MFRRLPFVVIALTAVWAAVGAAQSAPAPAQSVTGAWSGAVVFKADGETHEERVHAVLKQTGDTLAGTAGPDGDRQYRINNGKVTSTSDGLSVSFDVIVNGVHTAFDLKLVAGALKGAATIEGEDGRRHAATVELKPVK